MTPEQEEQVRRALRAAAEADQPGPMPPEVANRLDAVLADLTGSGRKEQVGTGDELAARRARRWPNVLVAAAAVAAIVAAGGAVATDGYGVLGGAGESTSAEKAAGSSGDDAAPSTSAPSASSSGDEANGLSGDSALRGDLPVLHTSTLTADVQALLRARRAVGSAKAPRTTQEVPADCARPIVGRVASLFVVRLDGQPATLVVGPARDGARRARVYSCDGAGDPLASVSVPTR